MPPRTKQFCDTHVSIMKTNIHMGIFHINKLVDVRTAYRTRLRSSSAHAKRSIPSYLASYYSA